MVSSKSDVWSFGVTVWEIFSYGAIPYGVSKSNKEIKNMVIDGGRLSCPDDSPEDIYRLLMLDCWHEDLIQRPNFTKLLNDIRALKEAHADDD